MNLGGLEYDGLPGMGRRHATVCHAERKWAQDDDGDGVRKVHLNTLEGLRTGLRNVLRPVRGVSKGELAGSGAPGHRQYPAVGDELGM